MALIIMTQIHQPIPDAGDMIGEITETPTGKYVRCESSSGYITREQDILDLLACCGEAGASRMMLDEKHLHPDFFDLKTGLAGTIFLKLSTYRVKAAFVVNWQGKSERFQEMVYECNRGDQINFFGQVAKAEKWLTT